MYNSSRRPRTPLFRDQDFYCSFTNLPFSNINLEELPLTIHSPFTITRLRSSMHIPPGHRRTPSGIRPDSFDSTNTTSTSRSYRSLFSITSTLRRRKFMVKMRSFFRSSARKESHHPSPTLLVMRSANRKPSTLDFRCIGTDSRMDLAAMFSTPIYDSGKKSVAADSADRDLPPPPFGTPPRIDVDIPTVEDDEWFDDI